jgi:hypothetical protein
MENDTGSPDYMPRLDGVTAFQFVYAGNMCYHFSIETTIHVYRQRCTQLGYVITAPPKLYKPLIFKVATAAQVMIDNEPPKEWTERLGYQRIKSFRCAHFPLCRRIRLRGCTIPDELIIITSLQKLKHIFLA